jgi:hypothetical protein
LKEQLAGKQFEYVINDLVTCFQKADNAQGLVDFMRSYKSKNGVRFPIYDFSDEVTDWFFSSDAGLGTIGE